MTFLDVRPPLDLLDPWGRAPSRALSARLDDGGHLDVLVYQGFPEPAAAPPQGEALVAARVTYRPAEDGDPRFPTFPEVVEAAVAADGDLAWNLGSFNAWEPMPDPTEDGVGLWITGVGRRGPVAPHLVSA